MTAVEMITSEMEAPKVSPCESCKSIIVATDGSVTALPAFNAASMLQAKSGAVIHVLTVIEPVAPILPAIEGVLVTPEIDRARREAQLAQVREQIRPFDSAASWSLDVGIGDVADVIAEFARERDADLIIIGTNKHGMLSRILGEETASDIVRLTDKPLLIASAGMKRLPKRVVIAMGLDADGLQGTAELIRDLTDSPGISCAHAKPRSEMLGIDWAEYDSEYDAAMRDRFRQFESTLAAANLRADLMVLHGDPVNEITDFAEYSKGELIVVGVKRRPGRKRAVGGRLASRMIRKASCSVLVVPSSAPRTNEMPLFDATDVIKDPRLWPETLKAFTGRNAGRTVTLEVDDPESGALVEATRYPLLGVDYDHRDGRLTISLGPTKGSDFHLTRGINRPEQVAVLSRNGRDTALSVSHGGGQTLLTF